MDSTSTVATISGELSGHPARDMLGVDLSGWARFPRSPPIHMVRKKTPPVDFFENIIEIGDAYFYGSPAHAGIVTAIKGRTITITWDGEVWDEKKEKWVPGKLSMNCRNPSIGVCLDKKGFV